MLNERALPQTRVVGPEWVGAQDPSRWLTAAEQDRLTAWAAPKRRAEWLAGRLAAKRLMREDFGLEPLGWEVARDGAAPTVGGGLLPGISLSLSHSDGLGAASWSDPSAEGTAGVDVQRLRPVHTGLCARVCAAHEQAQLAALTGGPDEWLLLFWSLKEAAIKARRIPWGRPLREIGVTLAGDGAAVITLDAEPPLTARYVRLGDWWLARAVRP